MAEGREAPLCKCPCGCQIGPDVQGICAWCQESCVGRDATPGEAHRLLMLSRSVCCHCTDCDRHFNGTHLPAFCEGEPDAGRVATSDVARALVLLHAAMTEIDEARGECSAGAWGTLLAVRDLLTGDPDV